MKKTNTKQTERKEKERTNEMIKQEYSKKIYEAEENNKLYSQIILTNNEEIKQIQQKIITLAYEQMHTNDQQEINKKGDEIAELGTKKQELCQLINLYNIKINKNNDVIAINKRNIESCNNYKSN